MSPHTKLEKAYVKYFQLSYLNEISGVTMYLPTSSQDAMKFG